MVFWAAGVHKVKYIEPGTISCIFKKFGIPVDRETDIFLMCKDGSDHDICPSAFQGIRIVL